jgi:hypothetical protein
VDAAIRPTYLFASGIYDKIILGQLRHLESLMNQLCIRKTIYNQFICANLKFVLNKTNLIFFFGEKTNLILFNDDTISN